MSFFKFKLTGFVFALLGVVFVFQPSQIRATDLSTATLSASADAYMYSDDIYQNYGTNQTIAVAHGESPYFWGKSVIKFDLSGVPAGSTIDSADMRLYLSSCNPTQLTITVSRIISNWTESTINWAVGQDMHPTSTGSIQLVNPPCNQNSWYDFYITDIMKAWTSGSTNYGVMLSTPDSGSFSRGFNSRDSLSGSKPQLVVNYYAPASAPAAGQPAGQSTTGSSSNTNTAGSTSTNSNRNSSSANKNSNGSETVPGTVNSNSSTDAQSAATASAKTGKVDQGKNYLKNLWDNPIIRIVLIVFAILFLAALTALITILVIHFRNNKQLKIKPVGSGGKEKNEK